MIRWIRRIEGELLPLRWYEGVAWVDFTEDRVLLAPLFVNYIIRGVLECYYRLRIPRCRSYSEGVLGRAWGKGWEEGYRRGGTERSKWWIRQLTKNV